MDSFGEQIALKRIILKINLSIFILYTNNNTFLVKTDNTLIKN